MQDRLFCIQFSFGLHVAGLHEQSALSTLEKEEVGKDDLISDNDMHFTIRHGWSSCSVPSTGQ